MLTVRSRTSSAELLLDIPPTPPPPPPPLAVVALDEAAVVVAVVDVAGTAGDSAPNPESKLGFLAAALPPLLLAVFILLEDAAGGDWQLFVRQSHFKGSLPSYLRCRKSSFEI